jgi:hypothetical protein
MSKIVLFCIRELLHHTVEYKYKYVQASHVTHDLLLQNLVLYAHMVLTRNSRALLAHKSQTV